MKEVIKKIGKVIKTASGDSAIVVSESGPKEIWISPKHWKAMDDEKKAIVVDLYHNENGYSKAFPFFNMTKPSDSYEVGITFNEHSSDKRTDNAIISSSIASIFKKLNIPYALLNYSELSKKRREYIESRTKTE